MSGTKGLYTPDVLATAMGLAAFGWNDAFAAKGSARSRSCGSMIEVGLALDSQGKIASLGIKSHACAVGQAAAAVFAKAATGCDISRIRTARQALSNWLTGEGPMPDWPGVTVLEPALAYPARHNAILLAWDAALDALGG
jgi:NifU-like protein involved in Fe-S cluster formation